MFRTTTASLIALVLFSPSHSFRPPCCPPKTVAVAAAVEAAEILGQQRVNITTMATLNTPSPTTPTTTASGSTKIPLIYLPPWRDGGGAAGDAGDTDGDGTADVASSLVHALQTSGFLLVHSPDMPLELQELALQAASQLLIGRKNTSAIDDKDETKSAVVSSSADVAAGLEGVIVHPFDPKIYIMLDSVDEISTKCKNGGSIGSVNDDVDDREDSATPSVILKKYWEAMERVKRQILTCIAEGLKLESNFFVKLHSKNQSALRLLHYPSPADSMTPTTDDEKSKAKESLPLIFSGEGGPIIRCKPHSDYGSITLLLTDGVPGLEALVDDEWIPVPYVKGALVVNIGSLLQDWTNGKLLATLHRVVVAGDGGNNKNCAFTAVPPRTSLAFFADPDSDVCATLKDPAGMVPTSSMYKSVADYILWRSGGRGRQRSGLAFSKEEEERAKKARTS